MSRSATLSILALLLAVAPLPARAFNGPGCGGNWSGSKSCVLTFTGEPLTVFGTALVSSGNANLRVWLSPGGSPEVPLLECAASGGNAVTCGDQIGPEDERIPNVPSQVRLTLQCNVSGRGSGTYSCTSGKNPT